MKRIKELGLVLLLIIAVLSGCSSMNTESQLRDGILASTTESEFVFESAPAPTTGPTATPNPTDEPSPEPTPEPTVEPTEALSVDSYFNIQFIDVGQASAALVECDGHFMLIDGGNKADSDTIFSLLKTAAVPKLDIVVGTHAHEDHIGGLPAAFNFTTADLTLCPVNSYDSDAFEDLARYADQNGGGIIVPSVGDVYRLGSATIEILAVNSGTDTNNTSIVLRINYGETSFLFTGDAEQETEQILLNSGVNLSADVLVVGHHGSETSTSYRFLREVMPQYAVISVGKDNSYGHPTDEVLSRLRDAEVKTFRTDLQGDIYCVSDGEEIAIGADRNEDIDVFSSVGNNSQQGTENVVEENESPNVEATDYVLNTNTKKFHYPDCSSVDQMKDHNRRDYSGTKYEVLDMGYVPCKRCNP